MYIDWWNAWLDQNWTIEIFVATSISNCLKWLATPWNQQKITWLWKIMWCNEVNKSNRQKYEFWIKPLISKNLIE